MGLNHNQPVSTGEFRPCRSVPFALNHPNVLAVHDVGTHDDAPYIASPPPTTRGSSTATSSPTTSSSRRTAGVKILDFGLAKLTRPGPLVLEEGRTATEATESGMVLGTVGYMSPEQVGCIS